MTTETLESPNPRNRKSISVIKSKFLSVSSMNTSLAILKVTDARRDAILAGGLYHRFPQRHLPPSLIYRVSQKFVPLISCTITFDQTLFLHEISRGRLFLYHVHVFRISVTDMPFLFCYHILQPLRHELRYSVQTHR